MKLTTVLALALMTFVAGCAGPSAKPEPGIPWKLPPEKPKVALLLAQVEPVAVSQYSNEQLEEMWPAFRHKSFRFAGFNHLTLPFLYISEDPGGDPAEALAFSFLLSGSIDWAPGGYCTRHAYFTFKRARRYMEGLAHSYSPKRISDAMEDWDATHAVGGWLVRGQQGYGGELVIYGPGGGVLFLRSYEKPRTYWQLLGDMAADAIGFFGPEPSPALAAHLGQPRGSAESIIDLGRAAFAAEKSAEEFSLYERILDRDPGFADVRYWYANQRQWHDGNRGRYMTEVAHTVNDYLVPAAAFDFVPDECPDKALASRKAAWLERIEGLVGPDFPDLVHARMAAVRKSGKIDVELRDRATRVAAAYPNEYWFLWELGRAYREDREFGADCNHAASLLVAAIRNRYLTSLGHKNDAIWELAVCMQNLGRHDICVQVLEPVARELIEKGPPAKAAHDALVVGISLFSMGRYDESRPYLAAAFKGFSEGDYQRLQALLWEGIATALAGHLEDLEEFITINRSDLEKGGGLAVLEGYREALQGKPVDMKAVRKCLSHPFWWCSSEAALFVGQMDLLQEKSKERARMIEWALRSPEDRRFWILLDAYDRKEAMPESAAFYEAMEWLRGEDAWVRKAVADYRKRSGALAPAVLSAADLCERLKEFEPKRWPAFVSDEVEGRADKIAYRLPHGAAAAALRPLLAEKKFKEAEELTLRYHHLAVATRNFALRVYANHLIHLVQQAQPKAAPAAPSQNELPRN